MIDFLNAVATRAAKAVEYVQERSEDLASGVQEGLKKISDRFDEVPRGIKTAAYHVINTSFGLGVLLKGKHYLKHAEQCFESLGAPEMREDCIRNGLDDMGATGHVASWLLGPENLVKDRVSKPVLYFNLQQGVRDYIRDFLAKDSEILKPERPIVSEGSSVDSNFETPQFETPQIVKEVATSRAVSASIFIVKKINPLTGMLIGAAYSVPEISELAQNIGTTGRKMLNGELTWSDGWKLASSGAVVLVAVVFNVKRRRKSKQDYRAMESKPKPQASAGHPVSISSTGTQASGKKKKPYREDDEPKNPGIANHQKAQNEIKAYEKEALQRLTATVQAYRAKSHLTPQEKIRLKEMEASLDIITGKRRPIKNPFTDAGSVTPPPDIQLIGS